MSTPTRLLAAAEALVARCPELVIHPFPGASGDVVLAITSEFGLPQYCPAYTFSPRGTLSRFIGQYPASRILAAASIPVCGLT